MRILLLNPPVNRVKFSRDGRCQTEADAWLVTFPPTTFASIAGAVREKYDVKLVDCMGANIGTEQSMDLIEGFNPDYSILNTATPTIKSDLETARRIKEKTDSKIIMYGEHITSRYKYLLDRYPHLDYAILSEPETPIMRILEGEEKSPGVAMRGWDGGLWQEPSLDDLPFPAYDLLPPYHFPLTGEKWTFVRSGRGCPYNCTYCVMPFLSGRKARYHSAEYMLRQFKWLVEDLGIKLWMMWDELATLDRERMEEMCRMMIQAGLHKKCRWFCTTRVDKLDFELAKKMKEAGCRMISFGIESGSQKVLDRNRKGITLEQTRKAVKAARDNKIRTIGHLIIGLPGSNKNTEEETIKLAKELKLDFAQFYTATPFPGSEFYSLAKKEGWFTAKNWEEIEQGSATISYPQFSELEIHEMRNKAYREFYFRPRAIWSGLTFMSAKQILKLPLLLPRFLKWMRK